MVRNPRSLFAKSSLLLTIVSALSFGQAEPNNLLKPGTPAPIFSLPGIDGQRTALRTWCGDTLTMLHLNKVKQTVVVSFWATWCKPCQKEIPELLKFMDNHKADPIKVFFISIDKEGVLVVRPHLQDKGWLNMPVLLDPYAKTAERYGVKSLPALFVIDPQGVIRYSVSGFEDGVDLGAKLDNVLANISSGRTSVATGETAGQTVSASGPAKPLTAHDRWHAVARVECGEKIEVVASELGTKPEVVHQWSDELKRLVKTFWADSTR